MSDVAIAGTTTFLTANLNELEENFHQVEEEYLFRFCRIILNFSDAEIDEFKKGRISEEDFFKMVKARLRNDPELLWRHRTKIRDGAVRQRIVENSPEILSEDLIVEAIYELIDGIDIKDREKFCREELGANPSTLRYCPVSKKLKKEMLDWWLREKARGRNEVLETALRNAEEFFEQNEGSRKTPVKVRINNLVIGSSNVCIDQSTRNGTG